MKILPDIVKAAGHSPADDRTRPLHQPADAGTSVDRLRLAQDRIRRVVEQNRLAAGADLPDFKKAEAAIISVKQRLLQDTDTAAALHRLGDRQVLFLLLA